MNSQNALKPRTATPDLEVATLDGGTWRLAEQTPKNFTLIVAYRGRHCPVCKTYIKDLDRNAEEFAGRGVEAIAVSSDTQERAQATKDDWEIGNIAIGYGMSIAKAREWGLYISKSRGKTSLGIEEPAEFNEPGLFLIRPDKTLYAASISTMPFARPHFKEVLAAVDFIVKNDYPARGEA